MKCAKFLAEVSCKARIGNFRAVTFATTRILREGGRQTVPDDLMQFKRFSGFRAGKSRNIFPL